MASELSSTKRQQMLENGLDGDEIVMISYMKFAIQQMDQAAAMFMNFAKSALPSPSPSPTRIEGYVDRVVPQYSVLEFRQHFRMIPNTFEKVTKHLGASLLAAVNLVSYINDRMKESTENSEQSTDEKVPLVCSKRWILAYVGMLGFCVLYSLRVNMSVAIVCMVRDDDNNDTDSTSSILGNDTAASDQCGSLEADKDEDRGEFDWDKSTQSIILSAFFYGYIVTQIPGGWISGKFGAKFVLGGGVLITALATVLVPVAARLDYRLVIALRAIMGVAEGVVFPSMQGMWGRWAPLSERTRLMSFCYTGTNVGNIVTFIVSGLLCAEGFDNGWGSVFYVTGGAGLLWCLGWFYLVSSTPDDHPTISKVERDYINNSIAQDSLKKFKVPWRALLTSQALWVCVVAHVCNNWMNYTMLTGLPSFMKEVLKFDIKQNGVLSAVPYVAAAVIAVTIGQVADYLRTRWLSTTATRRLIQAISFIGTGSLIVAVGFVSCDNRLVAVALLTIAVGLEGMVYGGYMVNHVDFAPGYAGVMFGITNFISTIPGIVAPIVTGALTPNKTQDEWRNVFYVCGAFTLIGAVVFGGFAKGETEPWARESQDPTEPATCGDVEDENLKEGKINPAFNAGSGSIKGGKD